MSELHPIDRYLECCQLIQLAYDDPEVAASVPNTTTIINLAMQYAANRKYKPSKAELLRVLDHVHRGSLECIL